MEKREDGRKGMAVGDGEKEKKSIGCYDRSLGVILIIIKEGRNRGIAFDKTKGA